MSKKKILIADDDPDILDAISLMLQIADYDVAVVKEGEKIIASIKDIKPDILLLDLWMSGVNGVDICNQIRKNNNTKNLPIILVSASNDIKKNASRAKFNDVIAKPFDMQDLLKKIARQTTQQAFT